jgi:hypothetical protein
MKRFLHARLLHYLVLGALLVAARDGLADVWSRAALLWAGRPEIVVSGEERMRIRQRLGIPDSEPAAASERELRLVDEAIDDEILYRAALERRLDEGNAVVRERVVQDMRVLTGDESAGDEEMLAEGLRLGLDRSDLVVRRHLASTMRLLAAAPARRNAVGEDELRDVLERHAQEFRVPAATTLRHLFFSNRRGREAADEASRAVLVKLGDAQRRDEPALRQVALRSPPGPTDSVRPGDAFALGSTMRERTDAELDAIFGPGFAAAVARAPENQWTGPFPSRYGSHLVFIESRREAHLPPLDAVRRRAIERASSDRARHAVKEWLARERNRYRIRIEEPASLSIDLLALPRPAAVVGD